MTTDLADGVELATGRNLMIARKRPSLHGASVLLALLATSCTASVEGPTIVMSESGWTVEPTAVEQPHGQFTLDIVNETSSEQRFLVVHLHEGEADALPVANGVVDTTRSCAAAQFGLAEFSVAYPGQYCGGEEQPPLEMPGVIGPGEAMTITIGGFAGGGEAGRYVAVSQDPDGYAGGDFVVFTMAMPPGVTEPPDAVGPATALFIVLGDYQVDAAGVSCSGAGSMEGIGEGSAVEIRVYNRQDTPVATLETSLPAGSEIVEGRDDEFLFEAGDEDGCMFDLGQPFDDDSRGDWFDVSLEPEPEAGIVATATEHGHVVWYGP